ncbi:hypothetical protein [Maridesulfovibrio sp.]|uniref:hypothetical protein n=1 Tax=Maridesulfovibrio sp. TaxID=2795000 RepID=UPI0039EEEDA1
MDELLKVISDFVTNVFGSDFSHVLKVLAVISGIVVFGLTWLVLKNKRLKSLHSEYEKETAKILNQSHKAMLTYPTIFAVITTISIWICANY